MRLRKLITSKLFVALILFIIFIVFVCTYLFKTNQSEYITLLPTYAEQVEINSKLNELINLTDFQYIIANRRCQTYDKEILAIIIVTSYVGHDELRAAHRQAISQTKLTELGMQRIFLLGAIPAREHFITQNQLLNEQQRFDDLLQGNFIEAYRNLSYKHIMGLRWAATECKQAKFIIKLDDDIVYDVFHLRRHLETLEMDKSHNNSNNLLAGFVLDTKTPIRNSANKWYVTRQEYPHALYPPYLSGWLYITNKHTASRLVNEAQRAPFFWIDDTWITGILRARLRISMTHLNDWFSANEQFLECCVRDLQEHNYECDYFVGPNGGQTKLIIEFLHNVEKCYFDECSKRPTDKTLKQTCVAEAKRIMPEHGQPQVRPVRL